MLVGHDNEQVQIEHAGNIKELLFRSHWPKPECLFCGYTETTLMLAGC